MTGDGNSQIQLTKEMVKNDYISETVDSLD